MSYSFPPDVAQLVQQHLASGVYSSEDDVLRDALVALGQMAPPSADADREFEETVAAVGEGVEDMEAGRMRLLDDVIDEARRQRPSEKPS